MNKNILILVLLLAVESLFAEKETIVRTDSIFFELNENYVKRIAVDYGSKKTGYT